tara:strand:- start:662 stop:1000 length:339 start_codon:yes stop_codon:yes gene_type:complete
MQREIKFRAWNIKTKEYNNYVEIYCYLDGSIGFSAGVNNNNPVGNSENFIIEQFTGLKDKNGVDIYEGDKLNNGWKISFKDGMFGFFDNNHHMGINSHMSGFAEVIGNIHEK